MKKTTVFISLLFLIFNVFSDDLPVAGLPTTPPTPYSPHYTGEDGRMWLIPDSLIYTGENGESYQDHTNGGIYIGGGIWSLDFSNIPIRNQSKSYSGSDSFWVWAWGSFFFVPMTWTEEHDYDWSVTLNIDRDNRLCYFDSEPYTLYVNKGSEISISSSVSGSYDGQINQYLYLNGNGIERGSHHVINERSEFQYYLRGPESTQEYVQWAVNIIPDDDYPYIKINDNTYIYETSPQNFYFNEDVRCEFEDPTSGTGIYKVIANNVRYPLQNPSPLTFNAEKSYNIYVEDLVGNSIEKVIIVDKTPPAIEAYELGTDNIYTEGTWSKVPLYVSCDDDELSGLKETNFINGVYSNAGSYKLYATDNAGNTTTKIIKIDNVAPHLDFGTYTAGKWTKEEVNITATDNHSGIDKIEITKNNETRTIPGKDLENPYIINETGIYTIKAYDIAGNIHSAIVKIDKDLPTIDEISFSQIDYRKNSEQKYIKSLMFNYSVSDNDSGIAENVLKLTNTNPISFDTTFKNISFKDENSFINSNRENDLKLTYSINVKDNAKNSTNKDTTLNVPKIIQIQTVEKENETVKRSFIKGDYTYVGILFNKIDFSKYKKIILKRTFLGDKKDDETEREIINYEEYRKKYDASVPDSIIKKIWDDAQKVEITEKDVNEIVLDGITYLYFEDKLLTETGLGHKGIRYQTEWVWKDLEVTECGKYTTIDKTANNSGKIKIRIQGTNNNGTEKRYIVLNPDGEKNENESDKDFYVPLDGVVKLSFKIDDKDIDNYNISAKEIINTNIEESEIAIDKTGFTSKGYIRKNNHAGKIVSEYYSNNKQDDNGWYEFENPELKLYYNKTINLKIIMEEGCVGDSGKYRDITESALIKLKAANQNLGGYSLEVGENVGYNNEGITAQPYQPISLSITNRNEECEISNIVWNFGDDSEDEIGLIPNPHAYTQSSKRTGNISEYTLTITLVQDQIQKTTNIKVQIIDTQSGKLLGNEEWIGVHPLLNTVQIPEGMILTIKNNDIKPENKTIILGAGSSSNSYRGGIEVLSGGKLIVEKGENTIVFTEGYNEKEFREINTINEKGSDVSLKWRGIKLYKNSEADIANTKIQYALIGLETEEDSKLNLIETEIKHCSNYGLKLCNTTVSETIIIDSCMNGIEIQKYSVLKSMGTLKIYNCNKGILCDGNLETDIIELNCIKDTGITLAGNLKANNRINVEGLGKCGIENNKGAKLSGKTDIKVKGFEEGIRNTGNIKAEGELSIDDSLKIGIRNEGVITAGSLNVKALSGRGYICGSGSTTKFDQSKIEAEEIGIHCTGTAYADFGKSEIWAEKYGIKTDKDKEGNLSLKLDPSSYIEGARVLWYDWEDGVLTEDEIEEKLQAE